MVVSPARDDIKILCHEGFREGLRVRDCLLLVLLELWTHCLQKRGGDARNSMVVRSALNIKYGTHNYMTNIK